MHQRETGTKIQASGASNAGTFSKLWNFTNPFCEKFRGEMQMSFRGGSEQNYEITTSAQLSKTKQILKLCKCCICFKS